MRFLLRFVVLMFPLVAAAQEIRVLEVRPASGPVSGGTQVTFKMNAVPECPIEPIFNQASFGDVLVAMEFGSEENTFTAVAPPHAAGPVDVTLNACGMEPLTVRDGYTYLSETQLEYEKVLFPVMFQGPGARGAMWRTSISAYNAGTEPVVAANGLFEGNSLCPAVCGCSSRNDVKPGETVRVCVGGFADPAGLLFYPQKGRGRDLHFSSRIFDVSRSTENAGTEINVVRESDFRTGPIVLADIPASGDYRTSLRVFDPDQHDGAQVRLTFIDPQSATVLAEQIVTLSYATRTFAPDPYPIRPAFAYVSDFKIPLTAMAGLSRFHIRITPITSGLRFWAFASITNNDTQMVTTVSPQ